MPQARVTTNPEGFYGPEGPESEGYWGIDKGGTPLATQLRVRSARVRAIVS